MKNLNKSLHNPVQEINQNIHLPLFLIWKLVEKKELSSICWIFLFSTWKRDEGKEVKILPYLWVQHWAQMSHLSKFSQLFALWKRQEKSEKDVVQKGFGEFQVIKSQRLLHIRIRKKKLHTVLWRTFDFYHLSFSFSSWSNNKRKTTNPLFLDQDGLYSWITLHLSQYTQWINQRNEVTQYAVDFPNSLESKKRQVPATVPKHQNKFRKWKKNPRRKFLTIYWKIWISPNLQKFVSQVFKNVATFFGHTGS